LRGVEEQLGERSTWPQDWIEAADGYLADAESAQEQLQRTKPKLDGVTNLFYSSMIVNACSWQTLCQEIPDLDDERLQKMAKRLYDTLVELEKTYAWSDNYDDWRTYIKCWSEDFHERKMRSVAGAKMQAEAMAMSDLETRPAEVVSTSAEAGVLSTPADAVSSTSDLPIAEIQMSQREMIIANGVDELLSKMQRTGGDLGFWGQSRSSEYSRAPLKGSVGTAEVFLKQGDAYEVGGVIETPDEAWRCHNRVGLWSIYIKRMIQFMLLSKHGDAAEQIISVRRTEDVQSSLRNLSVLLNDFGWKDGFVCVPYLLVELACRHELGEQLEKSIFEELFMFLDVIRNEQPMFKELLVDDLCYNALRRLPIVVFSDRTSGSSLDDKHSSAGQMMETHFVYDELTTVNINSEGKSPATILQYAEAINKFLEQRGWRHNLRASGMKSDGESIHIFLSLSTNFGTMVG
jgi:hypothetical protein